MVYIIPYIDYELKSLQHKGVILERFCNSVNVLQALSISKTSSYRDFEGVLHKNGFNLRRNIKLGYSAFLPILVCKIYEEKENVHCKVNIRFHKYVNIGILAFFLFQFSFLSLDFTSIVIIFFPYFLIIYLFNKEVRPLKEKINEIVRSKYPG